MGCAFSVLRSSDPSRLIDHKNQCSKCSKNACGPPIWLLKWQRKSSDWWATNAFKILKWAPIQKSLGTAGVERGMSGKLQGVCVCVFCVSVKALCSYILILHLMIHNVYTFHYVCHCTSVQASQAYILFKLSEGFDYSTGLTAVFCFVF